MKELMADVNEKKLGDFNFKKFGDRYLLTNRVGDFSFVEPETFDRLLRGEITEERLGILLRARGHKNVCAGPMPAKGPGCGRWSRSADPLTPVLRANSMPPGNTLLDDLMLIATPDESQHDG